MQLCGVRIACIICEFGLHMTDMHQMCFRPAHDRYASDVNPAGCGQGASGVNPAGTADIRPMCILTAQDRYACDAHLSSAQPMCSRCESYRQDRYAPDVNLNVTGPICKQCVRTARDRCASDMHPTSSRPMCTRPAYIPICIWSVYSLYAYIRPMCSL